jgi:hypothetical protein
MNALRFEVFVLSGVYCLPKAVLVSLQKYVMMDCISQFNLDDYLNTQHYRTPFSLHADGSDTPPSHNPEINPTLQALKVVVQEAVKQDSTLSLVLNKVQTQAVKASAKSIREILVPFMQWLLTILDLSTPATLEFCRSLLGTYISHGVLVDPADRYRSYPRRDSDWSRPDAAEKLRSCPHGDCIYCAEIITFLLDPRRSSMKYLGDEGYMHSFELAGDECWVYQSQYSESTFDFRKSAKERDVRRKSFEELLLHYEAPKKIDDARKVLVSMRETCEERGQQTIESESSSKAIEAGEVAETVIMLIDKTLQMFPQMSKNEVEEYAAKLRARVKSDGTAATRAELVFDDVSDDY